ncbi:MAG: hypothetical protein N4A31_02425 [Rickettsiales bacterium]|jgi:hypothetical protein|nr:hypothetical protein [Rickettsiales bacterium]
MREKRLRSPDESSQGDYKRHRENNYDEYDEELEEIDSQATISGENEENTTMMLAQSPPSIGSEPPGRQPSGEGYSWSFGSTQSSLEISILYDLPDPIQPAGPPRAEAMMQQDTDPTIPPANPTQHPEPPEEAAYSPSNEYNVSSQISERDGNNMSFPYFPEHQPSDYELYLNFTHSPVLRRSNTTETVVPQYSSQARGSGNTQEIFFFSIEDYNLPEDIYYNKPFDKLSKNMETNVIDLDFSDVLPFAGLFSIIMYSYM